METAAGSGGNGHAGPPPAPGAGPGAALAAGRLLPAPAVAGKAAGAVRVDAGGAAPRRGGTRPAGSG